MNIIDIIGIGLGPQDLTATQQDIIHAADLLVGGRRLLDHFKDLPVQHLELTKDLDELVKQLKEQRYKKRIAVLASGDPLFFGIGGYLAQRLGPDNIRIHPNITSVAAAFARLKEPWQGVTCLSLHGRDKLSDLWKALDQSSVTAVLTDPKQNPACIARQLIDKNRANFRMAVFEKLGAPDEAFGWFDLDQCIDRHFPSPNLVVLKKQSIHDEQSITPLFVGQPDNAFEHQKGLITKSEIRAVTLAKLKLHSDLTMWDLGAGSGSVSIEASLLVQPGAVFAVEKDAVRIAQIERNIDKFNADNITTVHGVFPEILSTLPTPDRVFIGGGGRHLTSIIETVLGVLKPRGVLVINTVLLANLTAAAECLSANRWHTEVVQLQVNRSKKMPYDQRLSAQNPVWIIRAEREENDTHA